MASTKDELQEKLIQYNGQLQQVDALLEADPLNDEFLQLKADLLQVIALTVELANAAAVEPVAGAAAAAEGEGTEPAASASAAHSSDSSHVSATATSHPPPPPPPPPPMQSQSSGPPVDHLHSQQQQQQQQQEEEAALAAVVDGSPFGVGSVVLRLNDAEVWQPSWIKASSDDGLTFSVAPIGDDSAATLANITSLKRVSPQPPSLAVHASAVAVGTKCQALYSADHKYYECTVGKVLNKGYEVTFDGYGNVEVVPLEWLRRAGTTAADVTAAAAGAGGASAASGAAGGGSGGGGPSASGGGRLVDDDSTVTVAGGKKVNVSLPASALDAEGNFKIPDNLRINPGDTEKEQERKRKKVKQLKGRFKLKQTDQDIKKSASDWQSFSKAKGSGKRVRGSMKGLRKESIFKTPESLDGKVGVVGSGQGMTEFATRHKFQKTK